MIYHLGMKNKQHVILKIYRGKVNAPSTLQSAHEYHGMVGIFVERSDRQDGTLLLVEGDVFSLMIDKLYVENLEKGA